MKFITIFVGTPNQRRIELTPNIDSTQADECRQAINAMLDVIFAAAGMNRDQIADASDHFWNDHFQQGVDSEGMYLVRDDLLNSPEGREHLNRTLVFAITGMFYIGATQGIVSTL